MRPRAFIGMKLSVTTPVGGGAGLVLEQMVTSP
jgi:hypothetical protein